MALKRFCPECMEETDCISVRFIEEFNVRGENIKAEVDRLKCNNCLNVFPASNDEEERIYRKVYSEYRSRKNLLQPDEIIALRKKYGLSQRQFAKILGWSHATLSRYESGALQSKSHNDELMMLQEPSNMLLLLEKKAPDANRELGMIIEKVKGMADGKEEKDDYFSWIEKSFVKKASAYTGFKVFNQDKFLQTVKFFACKDPRLFKVKLMKYLWYADFLHFKRATVSINGLQYVHLPLGPVPDNYNLLLHLVETSGHFEKEYVECGHDNLGELYKPVGEFDDSLFSAEELQTLNYVYEKFKHASSRSISSLSHEETAWLETDAGEPISYEHALKLSLS
jgi:putative zinc finger/helix-turn-helix YgiT family protein